MKNNFIKHRESENSKLLALLINRQKQSILSNSVKNTWPGKLRPSFTESVKNLTKIQQKILRRNSQRCLRSNILKNITSVQASPRTLSLRPSTVGWQTQKYTTELNKSKKYNKTLNQKFNVIKIEQNTSEYSFTMFKNSKISKRMSQVLSSKLLQSGNKDQSLKISQNQNQSKTFRFNGQILQVTKSKQTFGQNSQQQKNPQQNKFYSSHKNIMRTDKKKSNQQYKIDYFTFNYINKVIDTPELWMKYVHKINKRKKQ